MTFAMRLDRRSLLLGAGTILLAGCSKGEPSQAATVPMPKMAVDMTLWQAFKAAHLAPDGRVVDTGNGGISHSEGQGYGLLIAEAAGDRDAFDSIFAWTERSLLRPYDSLYSWRYDPRAAVPVGDINNAADGDILIAWALLRGGVRWRDAHLTERSAQVREAIVQQCVRRQGGRTILLPGAVGYDHPDRMTVNLSYYIWPALDQFRATGEGSWADLVRDGEKLLDQARTQPLGLPTDWTDISADGSVTVSAANPPRFGFDAVRIPLYLMLGNRAAKAGAFASYWRPYLDAGQAIPAWVDVVTRETAPYPLSEGGNAIVTRLLKRPLPTTVPIPPADYYSRVLSLLASLH